MKAKLLSILPLFVVFCASAQSPVITSATFSNLDGIARNYKVLNNIPPDAYLTGINQSWDFSSATTNFAVNGVYATSGVDTFIGPYYTKTVGGTSSFSESFFYALNGNSFEFIGERRVDFQSLVVKYLKFTDPREMFRFPLTYGSSIYNDTYSEVDYSNLSFNSGLFSTVVDGYGTMKNPDGRVVADCLRLKSTDVGQDSTFDGSSFRVTNYKRTSYIWLSPSYTGLSLFQVGMDTFVSQSNPTNVQTSNWAVYTDLPSSPTAVTELSLSGFSLYPNPATNTIDVNFTNFQQYLTMQVVDLTGKVQMTVKSNSTEHETIDITALNAGYYWLQIKSNAGIETRRFVKQ